MEKDLISLIEEFLLEQPTDISNNIFYQEDVGGVKYEFVLELPDDIPTKTGISGNEIIDVKKLTDDTVVNVQRVFPDGETVVDYSFNARGKGGDVEAYKNFNKILKEGEGMKGVLLNYYDTFPVETTLPTTNVVDDIAELENTLNEKYSDVLEFNYNAFGDDMESTKPLQIGLRKNGVLGVDVISVSDSAQGQGYGRSIMNDIIDFANKNNLEIQLEPLEGQEEFFKKLGFEQFGDDIADYRKLPSDITDDDIADLGLDENDLADGDAMTERFLDEGDEVDKAARERDLLELARELGILEEGPMDTSNLSKEARDKLNNLADDENKAMFYYDMEDIENYANGNTKITAEQAQELQQMTGMFTDKADEIVNKLPLEETVKKD